MTSSPLMTTEAGKQLIGRLSQLAAVRKFDRPGEPQSVTLTHALTDLESSFRLILHTLLPKILDVSLDENDLNDALLDLGEELRHVLYHIKDPEYLNYLIED